MNHLTQSRRGAEKIFLFLGLCLCAFVLKPEASVRPNVLMISIDTLRADRLGCYGYKTKTPAIDALASESVLFENAISQVPLTLPSHTTMFTGLYPPQHGIRNNENFRVPEKFTTIAELFKQQGYATGAVVGSFSLDSSFGLAQGFDYYEDRIGTGKDPELNRHVERRAESVWKLGKTWIDGRKGPWFVFLHFFDPHYPYSPPVGFEQSYDGEVAYTDRIISALLQHLKQTGALNTTIIVLLSDHGESLGEHGEDNHGIFVYDSTVLVPLMVWGAGVGPARIREQVRLADVAPTIATLAGFTMPGAAGESLVPFFRGNRKELPAYSESYYANLLMGWAPLHAVRWKGKKWIDAPKPELFDLTSDPRELKNLYKTNSIPAAFRAELRKHLEKPARTESITSDPETREKLASLGYLGGSSSTPVQSGFDPKNGIALWIQIEAAVRDTQLRQWASAVQKFRDVLDKQPDNVIAQKFLANVLRKQQKYDEAIALMQRALQSPLHRTETRFHLAETYLEKKDFQTALQQATILLQSEPHNQKGLALAAWLQAHLKRDEEALRSYSALAMLRDLTEEEGLQAASVALTNGKINVAEKFFRDAIRANSKSIPAWKGLALIHASRRQWDDAAAAFQKAGDCNSIRDLYDRLNKPSQKVTSIFNQCKS